MFEVFTITAPSKINTVTNTGISDWYKPISVWIYHSGYGQWYLMDAHNGSYMQVILNNGYINVYITAETWVNQTMKLICIGKSF